MIANITKLILLTIFSLQMHIVFAAEPKLADATLSAIESIYMQKNLIWTNDFAYRVKSVQTSKDQSQGDLYITANQIVELKFIARKDANHISVFIDGNKFPFVIAATIGPSLSSYIEIRGQQDRDRGCQQHRRLVLVQRVGETLYATTARVVFVVADCDGENG